MTDFKIELTTEFGQRVALRLGEERIIWLTTVSKNGTPQPRPVWFLWDGTSFLIYSRPNGFKLKHIEANPKVALNLDSDGKGGDIVVIIGEASIDDNAPPGNEIPVYLEKYRGGMRRIQMTPEEFSKSYSVAIKVRPLSLRGH